MFRWCKKNVLSASTCTDIDHPDNLHFRLDRKTAPVAASVEINQPKAISGG